MHFCLRQDEAMPEEHPMEQSSGRKRLKTAFNVIYEVISTAVIVIAVLLAVLYLCGIRLYRVKTGSMGVLMPEGSVCFVSTYSDFDKISTGDVISFRVSDEMLVTHRAVRITAEGVYTQGDGNDTEDPDPVTKENYIGKAVFALPYIGGALGFLHTAWGIAAMCGVLVLLIAAGAFYRRDSD